MQRLVTLLRSLRERLPPSSASAPRAAGASELREEGRGGLYSAAASGNLSPLRRRWWRRRLRINERDERDERDAKPQMPLHLACANNHADVVQVLAGRERHLNPCDNFQKTPLMEAVEDQHKDCLAVLLEHGAISDFKGAGGNSALHLAVAIPSKPLVELLLEHKACINAQNELGYTPLTLAITKHCEEMVEFLLQKGADVHVRDKHRRTPLMAAAAAGDMNVVQLLLRHGADLSHEDPFGHTAVYYARVFQHANIANQLEEYIRCERMAECSAGGREGPAALDSSCSGRTADVLLGTASLTGAGVLPAAAAGAEQEEDVDFPWDSETDSEGPGKELGGVLLPAGGGCRLSTQSVAEERGNGVLPAAAAAGAEQEEDVDSPWDSETDSEGPRKALGGVLLPAGGGCRLSTQSVAEERGNGVLPAAAGAEQEEDVDSPWDSETDSEGPRKALGGVLLPAGGGCRLSTQSVAEERGNGVLPAAAGAEQEEDVDSPWDSETDSEGPRKALGGVLLPAGGGCRLSTQSVAEERGNGVLPAAAGAEQEEDVDSPWDSETDSEGPGKELGGVLLPAGGGCRLSTQSVAEERGNGVLPAAVAGAEQEEDVDSPWDPETDSEGPGKALDSLPKKDASTQTDFCHNGQKWISQLQQELADTAKKNFLAEASLKAKKRYTRDLQKQKLQLQKEFDRSETKLQELKECSIWTDYYAVYLKNAIKERELTSRKLQGCILDVSSATATITELEERIKQLQVGNAKLKATVQQQAKTIEALQKEHQAFASASHGPEDLETGFQTTPSAKEQQHQQHGRESKEVKKMAKMKRHTEAPLVKMKGKNATPERECTRHGFLGL